MSLGALLAALLLQTLQIAFDALAWRNILRAAYPDGGVRYPQVFGAYAGGVGLNQLLPAQAGTIAMLGLYRGMIAGATVPGVIGAQLVQTLFFAAAGVGVYVLLFFIHPGAGDVHFGVFLDHPVLAVVVVAAVVAGVVLVIRLLRRRLHGALHDAKEGAAILRTPSRYATGVLLPQMGSYASRMGAMAVLMSAYGVPVSLRNIFLIIAAGSISTLVALTPGGVGTQQALAVAALSDVSDSATVAAYSLGQQAILAAWSAALGLVALSVTVGWGTTRGLIHERWVEAREGHRGADEPAHADHDSP